MNGPGSSSPGGFGSGGVGGQPPTSGLGTGSGGFGASNSAGGGPSGAFGSGTSGGLGRGSNNGPNLGTGNFDANRGSPGGGFGSGGSSGGGIGRGPASGMGGGMPGGASFGGRVQQGPGSAVGGRNGDGFQQARSTGIGYGGGGGGRGDPGFMNQQGGGFQQQQQGQGRNLFQNLGRLPEGSAQRPQDGQFPKADAYAMSTPGSGLGYNSGYSSGRSYNKYRTLDQESRGFGSPQGPRATFSATDGASQLPPCYNAESRYLKYRTLDGEMNRQAQQVRYNIFSVMFAHHLMSFIQFLIILMSFSNSLWFSLVEFYSFSSEDLRLSKRELASGQRELRTQTLAVEAS